MSTRYFSWGLCLGVALGFGMTAGAVEKPKGVDEEAYADLMVNETLDIQDLAEGAEIQRLFFNRITPPGISWLQPMFSPLIPFDAVNFTESFLDGLLGEDKNSVAIYPLSLALDPKTRETLVYNSEGKLIATVPADKTSRSWPKDADPARVTLQLNLLPSEDVEPYLYTEDRLAKVPRVSKSVSSEGMTLMSLGAGQFGFSSSQKQTNGTVTLTMTNGTDLAEIYSYTVLHTASVVVVTWTNDQSNVVTDTNTLWTPVSPPFYGIESEWVCRTTNLLLTNGVGVWSDVNISSNERVRFYAAAKRVDSDVDGLTDGAEILIHRTQPGVDDTDGDGMSDGWEIQYGLNPLLDDSSEDADDDGLINGDEYEIGTNPVGADSDGDELSDWAEIHITGTEPTMYDSDNDGISDGDELSSNFWEEPSNRKSSSNGIQLPNNTPRYSFVSELNWNGVADLDNYAKDEESEDVVWYANRITSEVTLNHDAHPVCMESPLYLAPEIIQSTNLMRCGRFSFWYNQYSDCEPAISPSKSTVCITNEGAVTILVNGTMLHPGRSMQLSLAYGGYNTESIPDFTGGTPVDVTFLSRPCLSVKFVKLWESANSANYIFNRMLKDDPPEIDSNRLYVVESPDSLYHVTLEVNDQPPSMRSKLMHAVYDGGTKLSTGEGFFPSSGPAVANIEFNHPLGSAASITDFEIKVGYDMDGNSALDTNEIIDPFEVKNAAGAVIGPPMVKGASTTRYAACAPALTILMLDPLIPHGKALLHIFLDGNMSSVDADKQPTQANTVSFNCFSDPFCVWLTHNAGASFNVSGLASIPNYVWSTNTSLAHLLCNSFTMKTAAEAFYNATVLPVANAFFATNSVGAIAAFPLDGTSYSITYSNESPTWVDTYLSGYTVTYSSKDPNGLLWSSGRDDARVTIGRGRVLSHTAQFTIKKMHDSFGDYLKVMSAHYTGLVKDLYDFNEEDPGPGGIAAIIQLGNGNGSYGTGRATGLIFRDDIQVDEIVEYPFGE